MKPFLKTLAISATVALFAVAAAGAANAGGSGHGKHRGGQHGGGHYAYGLAGVVGHLLFGGYSYSYRYGNSYGDGRDRGRGYGRRHDHRRHGHGGYGRTGYGQMPGYVVRRPCHATSKNGYAHGRRAKIGGTMCYDNYGNAYIVAGSRHVIGYY